MCGDRTLHVGQREQSSGKQMKGMKDFVIDCLKTSQLGRREGEGRKRTTVRAVRLSSALLRPNYYPGSAEVEEYGV